MAGEWPQVPLGDLVRNFDSRRIPLSSRERKAPRAISIAGFCKSATLVNARRPYSSLADIAAPGEYAALLADVFEGEA